MSLINNDTTSIQVDPYSTNIKQKADFYKLINKVSEAKQGELIDLPNGMKVDLTTPHGLTVYTTLLNFYGAHNETLDNIYTTLKSIEKQLMQFLSSG